MKIHNLFSLILVFLLSFHTAFAQLTANATMVQNADCFLQNATIQIVVSGGTPPYSIDVGFDPVANWISTDTVIVSGIGFSDMSTRMLFDYFVTDSNYTTFYGIATIVVDALFGPPGASSVHNKCGCSDTLDIAPYTNGVPPYSIIYQNDTFLQGIGLCNSTYGSSVIDSRGCPVYTTISTLAYSNRWDLSIHLGNSFEVDTQRVLCPPFTWIDGNTYHTDNDTATYILSSAAGCDSVIQLNLTFQDSFPDVVAACDSFTWVDGITYTQNNQTATYTFNNIGPNSCDSTLLLDLTILHPENVVENISSCGPYTWVDGNTYSSNGTYYFTQAGGASNGCDKNYTLNLTILSPSSGIASIVACDSYTWLDGNTYTANNQTATYTLIGGNSVGCDSTLTLNLTVINSPSGVDHISACDSYTWIDGITYTSSDSSATFTLAGAAANGCDSIVQLDLTILESTHGVDEITSCTPIIWIDGNTYTSSDSSATFTLAGAAANGCDSIVQLDLTVLESTRGVDVITSCSPITWIDGNTYVANNQTATYTYAGGDANGCDSIVSLNFSIPDTIVTVDRIFSCGPYTWIDGNTYTANNQVASFTFSRTANSCDSIVKLDLTVFDLNLGLLLTTNDEIISRESQASYQWLDCDKGFSAIAGETGRLFKPSKSGYYAVQVEKNSCLDTSDCYFYVLTDLENPLQSVDMQLYPNPTTGMTTIDFGWVIPKLQLNLFTLSGQLIYSEKVEGKAQTQLELSGPKGVYFLEINIAGGERRVLKVVKF